MPRERMALPRHLVSCLGRWSEVLVHHLEVALALHTIDYFGIHPEAER